jgi:hypothetical protein
MRYSIFPTGRLGDTENARPFPSRTMGNTTQIQRTLAFERFDGRNDRRPPLRNPEPTQSPPSRDLTNCPFHHSHHARCSCFSVITYQEVGAQQSRKSNFLPAEVVDFQHLQQTQVGVVELRHHLLVAAGPGLALAAELAVVRSIGSTQRNLHSPRKLHKGLPQAG